MEKGITYMGLDVHQKSIVVAAMLPGATETWEWEVRNDAQSIRRMIRKIQRASSGEVRVCYEAGPCGYVIKRQLDQMRGVSCEVVVPSLIPVKPGERVKTDRRDARKLVRLFRSGDLTMVRMPSEDDEAVRDLCRSRDDARRDLLRSRHRLTKYLLRRGLLWRGRAWTKPHRSWLLSQRFERPADEVVFGDYLLMVVQQEERVRSLETAIEAIAETDSYREAVGWLRCFRGIDTVTAMTVLSEIHDFRRFEEAPQLMAYLGLVPSEHTSSETCRRGPITKTGNSHVRRLLVEAAWHYRHQPRVGVELRRRRAGQPAWAIAIAERAQLRLCHRFRRLALARGKATNKVAVAAARELAGFIWAVMQQGERATGTT